MNPRYIIGGIIAIVALTIGFISMDNSKIAYSDLGYAAESGKRVQVKGEWVKEQPADYDSRANVFTFTMKDTTDRQIKVIYNGARPNNFELAESIVVKGRVEGGVMHADNILTKCPSKYENNADQVKKMGGAGA
jgi:cytochrome c-type biogenesis protein CcmE